MKIFWKAIIIAIIAVAGTSQANAQFRFGVKAGVNLNKLHFSNLKENFKEDNGCGFTGGVMTEFNVPIIGICMDASLMYTHMAAGSGILKVEDSSNQEEVKTKKDFLEIPINLKYKFPVPMVRPYIFTGPSLAFKFGGENDVLKTKTFQCAWNVGVGFELFNHLQVSGSYGFGMNNIVKKLDPIGVVENTTDNIKLKNNYWTITAAYLF